MRRLVFAAAIAILVWASLVVPLPFFVLEPVEAMPTAGIVEVASDGQLPGDVLFTAVEVRQSTTVGTVDALLDEHRDVELLPVVVPAGVDPEEFVELQERLFEESIQAAAAVGQRAAGEDVTIDGDGARIVRVVPGTPAERVLQQGDVIVAIDGERIRLASEVVSILADRPAGEEVEVTVVRGDQEVTERIVLAELAQTGQPGLGVLATTLDLRVEMPVQVEPRADVRVGGPSAGLMVALTVYDLLTDRDLTGDRIVAGTGTIDLSGNVGRVDGVPQKVRGAIAAGADLFVVPAPDEEVAREAAGGELEVVAVSTLDEAIAALSG